MTYPKHLKLIIKAVEVEVIETTGETVEPANAETQRAVNTRPSGAVVKAQRTALAPEFEAMKAWRQARIDGRRSA